MILLYPCANLEYDYPIGHPEFIDQPRPQTSPDITDW